MSETEPAVPSPHRAAEPAWLARALRPITEVLPGEAVTALLLTANVFFLLTAYYVLKPLREGLILHLTGGAELKVKLSGAIALALFVIVPAYGKLVDRLPRIRLVVGVSLAFALQLLVFFAALRVPSLHDRLGLVFFPWVGVFNVMVVAQFWGYANDLYDKDQGDRLFPMVAIGASVGAAVGSKLAKFLVNGLGELSMPLVAAALLTLCSALFWLVERREAESARQAKELAQIPRSQTPRGGFGLVARHRYLLLLALFSLVYNWVNTNGEYLLSKLIKADVETLVARGQLAAEQSSNAISAAYADFYFYVNVGGVLLQTFVVSRAVKWLRLPAAFLFLPLLAFGNALVFAFVPIVALAKIGKAAENATDYSLNNTLKQLLWLVTSPDMKYKAKQVVDTFCVRMGDVCSALSVILLVDTLAFSVERFAWLSIALAAVWLVLAVAIGRLYRGFEQRKERLGT